MRTNVVGLVAVLGSFAFHLAASDRADACGIPPEVKKLPSTAVTRSANPSKLLVVGSTTGHLVKKLSLAGHKVDSAKDPASAKDGSYAIVIVDSDDQVDVVRKRFRSAAVMVRSGNDRADLSTIESSVARPVLVAMAPRPITPTSAKARPMPVASGPARHDSPLIDFKRHDAPAPATVTTGHPSSNEVRGQADAKPVTTELHQEVFFGLGSAKVGNAEALANAFAWLDANSSANIILEGYADPTGTAAANLALSQTRAETVRDFLIGKGIDPARIHVKALGDTHLKYGRTDRRNRRVAIDATP